MRWNLYTELTDKPCCVETEMTEVQGMPDLIDILGIQIPSMSDDI